MQYVSQKWGIHTKIIKSVEEDPCPIFENVGEIPHTNY